MNNRIKQKWHGQAYCSADGKSCKIEWENNLSMYEYDASKTIDRLFSRPAGTFSVTFVSDGSNHIGTTSIAMWVMGPEYPVLVMPEWDDMPTGVTRRIEKAIQSAILEKEQEADEAARQDKLQRAVDTLSQAAPAAKETTEML